MDQGFTKLILVLFELELAELFSTLKDSLVKHDSMDLIQDVTARGKKLKLQEGHMLDPYAPVNADYRYSNQGTAAYELLYGPQTFTGAEIGVKKADLITANDRKWDSGWRILFVQSGEEGVGVRSGLKDDTLERTDVKHPRVDLPTGKSPKEYLEDYVSWKDNAASPYNGEKPMAIEEWIMTCLTHLDETGEILDEDGTLLLDMFLPGDNSVPFVYTDFTTDEMGDRLQSVVFYSRKVDVGSPAIADIGMRTAVQI